MGDANFMGGLLGGLSQSLHKQQEVQILKDYRDAQVNLIKNQAKHEEAKINADLMKLQMQAPFYQAAAAELQKQQEGGGVAMPMAQPGTASAPQSFSNEVAQAQLKMNNPLQPTGGQAPPLGGGMVQMSPAGQKSTRYNNPLNLEYRPWQDKYGAVKGEDGRFGKYPTSEAGLAAATERIQQMAASGATVASSIETWAPTSENPNTPQRIAETAKALGVSPNTPLAQVPLYPFVALQTKYESPTQINPAVFGEFANLPIGQTIGKPVVQMTQAPQQGMATPPILPAQPRTPMITGAKVLAGILKKEFGIEPEDAKVVPYGDHKLVTDKAGNPQFIIAGQGKMEMVDVKMPDGRVIRQPQLIPPSPLPGGIPVYNVAGQPASNVAGPILQTSPPTAKRQEVTGPDGSKHLVTVGEPQLGEAPIKVDPAKSENAVEALKQQSIIGGLRDGERLITQLMNNKNEVNNALVLQMSVPGVGGIGQGRGALGSYRNAVDAIVRGRTGAAIRPDEWPYYDSIYKPTVLDPDNVKIDKINRLRDDLQGAMQLVDPGGLKKTKAPVTPLTPQTTKGMKVDPLGLR